MGCSGARSWAQSCWKWPLQTRSTQNTLSSRCHVCNALYSSHQGTHELCTDNWPYSVSDMSREYRAFGPHCLTIVYVAAD